MVCDPRHPDETEYELVQRRNREADERHEEFMKSIPPREHQKPASVALDRPQDRAGYWEYGR